MNEQVFPQNWLKRILLPNPIQSFLRCLRKLEYLDYKKSISFWYIPFWLIYRLKYNRLSVKLGFDIPINALGYGCRIEHICGIIISGSTHIGNYCCLYRVSFADGNPKYIGNNVFIGTNVVVTKSVIVADGCSISAMSLLNSNMLNSNELWGGVVAKKIKDLHPWTDSEPYKNAYERCEQLKKKMNII